MALGENVRLAARIVAHGARMGGRRFAGASAALRAPARSPEKILIAPQDLRASDGARAVEIYAGVFAFARKTVETRGGSPFLAEAPSRDWAAALHGFGWLRHLRAADTSLARENARALVDEWISLRGGPDPAAHSPEATARRVIAWLCHSPLIVDGADKVFYRRFLRSLARQTRGLTRSAATAPAGAPRLLVATALAYAALCLSGEARAIRAATRTLTDELDRQILPDGGHVSRNPAEIVELLLDLVPLRQAFAARNLAPPQTLLTAIDRTTPMLRFFRHGDGEFAQFNGAGPTALDLVATALAYDDAGGAPADDAPYSGYQRIAAGRSLVLIDTGAPPPFELSDRAHAGCLSFEFSQGPERIVVNCGAPAYGRADWERAARSTPAHSTATIGEESSCRFASGRLRPMLGARMLGGPANVTAKRVKDERGVGVVASHDGYLGRFGLLHERALTLSQDGARLAGEDVFTSPAGPLDRDVPVALRFHLHPSVRASARQDGQGVVLALPGGAGWSFSAPGFPVALEESVYLADVDGPRRCEQIVVAATARGAPRIAWALEKLPAETPGRRRSPAAEELASLPL